MYYLLIRLLFSFPCKLCMGSYICLFFRWEWWTSSVSTTASFKLLKGILWQRVLLLQGSISSSIRPSRVFQTKCKTTTTTVLFRQEDIPGITSVSTTSQKRKSNDATVSLSSSRFWLCQWCTSLLPSASKYEYDVGRPKHVQFTLLISATTTTATATSSSQPSSSVQALLRLLTCSCRALQFTGRKNSLPGLHSLVLGMLSFTAAVEQVQSFVLCGTSVENYFFLHIFSVSKNKFIC